MKEHVRFDTQMAQIGRHHWSVARLVMLSRQLEVMEIPLKHLCVFSNYKSLTLREMAGHVKAVIDADMALPIILDEDGEIMDGRHRIMHAMVYGIETIRAVRFDKNPTPCREDTD
jgi:hypothetical protein